MGFESGNDSLICSVFDWHAPSPTESLECICWWRTGRATVLISVQKESLKARLKQSYQTI